MTRKHKYFQTTRNDKTVTERKYDSSHLCIVQTTLKESPEMARYRL